jgi:hypothetical protein
MRKWWLVILLVAVLALAGCNGGKKSETATPTATAFVPTPLPPTWTASPPGFVPSPTDTQALTDATNPAGEGASTQPAGGTPLPPTWTALPPGFIPSPTDVQAPTATMNLAAEGASTQPAGGTPFPPTWTALPPGFVPSPTDTQASTATTNLAAEGTSTQPAGGTPFPPTWTPGKKPTATPRVTATPREATLAPAPTWTAQPDYCYTLKPLGDNPQITIGQPATVSWSPIAGFDNYWVTVRHPGGGIILQEPVQGASVELPGSLFTVSGAYGWDVRPLDDSGLPICFPVSGEIMVSF